MKKNIILFIICLSVLLTAYRFGDPSLKAGKTTFMQELQLGVTKGFFPMVTLYQLPEGQLLSQDVENLVFPILGKIHRDTLIAEGGRWEELMGSDKEEGESTGTSGGNKLPGFGDTLGAEGQSPVISPEGNGDQLVQAPAENPGLEDNTSNNNQTGSISSPSTGDIPANSFVGIEKKVQIDREKLLDFTYLVDNYFHIDPTTTVSTSLLNPKALLSKNLKLTEGVEGPQVLIYHTHSQEGYKDHGNGHDATSVMAVGDYLEKLLNENYGIRVLHHKGEYDVKNHADSYANALPALEQVLKDNPSIEVVIDLHRDGVPESTHLVTTVNGKPTARLMFFNGMSYSVSAGELAYLKNPYREDNLAFSLQLQVAAEEYFPGLMRDIYLKAYRYNLHLCPKSILVEVGAQTNSYEEAKNAMEPLAFLLAKVLKTDKVP